jgi:hypothetical protein
MNELYLSKIYMNFRRMKQARFLLPWLQQAIFALPGMAEKLTITKDGKTTLNTKDHTIMHCHVVLQALGCRMANRTDLKTNTIINTCFPDLDTLCVDTQLGMSTVHRSLDLLIDIGFITKSPVPPRKRPRKNESRFASCRYHLVSEIWDLIPYKSDDADAVAPIAHPYIPAPRSTADIAAVDKVLASIGEQQEETDFDSPSNKYEQVDAIVALLREHFGDHPTFQQHGAANIMAKSIRNCIDAAGSGKDVLNVFNYLCLHPDKESLRSAIAATKMLGGYIQKAFVETWLNEWRHYLEGAMSGADSLLLTLCEGVTGFDVPMYGGPLVDVFVSWLNKKLGKHLLDVKVTDGDDRRELFISISDAFKTAHLLSSHTGQSVSADRLPTSRELAPVATWAVQDPDWSERLKEAADVEEFFLDNLNDIEDAFQGRSAPPEADPEAEAEPDTDPLEY